MDGRDNKINKQNVQDILSLTPMQEGMLFHYLKNEDSSYYFEQLTLKLHGEVEIDVMKKTWDYLVQTNEMLRTVFKWDKLPKPMQIILKKYELPLQIYDLSKLNQIEQQVQVKEISDLDQKQKLDLTTEPFRVTIIILSNNECIMLLTYHHILYDGWSNGIILKEFFEAYNLLAQGESVQRKVKTSFKEFVKWLQGQDHQKEQEYWQEYLAGFERKTELPVTRGGQSSHSGNRSYTLKFDQELTHSLQRFAQEYQVTSATVLYTVWGILLQRYNNTDDVLFGTTVAGRNANIQGMEEMVGLFINTIPLRVQAHSEEQIITLLKKIDLNLRERTEYENTPLTEIRSSSPLDTKEELFDSIVVIENYPLDKQLNEATSLKVESYSMTESTNFDLALGIEMNDEISLQFGFDSAKFDGQVIERMATHFANILSYLMANPTGHLSEVKMLAEAETRFLIADYNNRALEYPTDTHICQLIEQWSVQRPEGVAVKFLDQTITYAQLNQRADQLAHFLREQGVAINQPVGIMAERSIELIVGILAILKAGGAYLPINPNYPAERIRYLLEDSQVDLLLTHTYLQDQVPFAGQIIALEDQSVYLDDGERIEIAYDPESIAYIIYTSGSTGQPKGVMVPHRALNNFLFNIYQSFGGEVGPNDHSLSLTNISFDVSVCEIFMPLAFGATLVLFNNEMIPDIQKLAQTIIDEKITFAYIPPSLLRATYDRLAGQEVDLNKLLVGVEPIQDYVLEEYQTLHPKMQIINGYGPTEATICATFYKYGQAAATGKNVPIGQPLANTQIYILDQELRPLPVGMVGELWISGDGLALGYMNRGALTKEKFVSNPFRPGAKMYRTGDLARILPDGNIQFQGRIDHQVKIRGFRIEPGEIESQLLNYSGIQNAIVIDREDQNGVKYLVAYFKADQQVIAGDLREYLLKLMPDYMVPSYFVQLEEMPLSSNGKIDRKALPKPEGDLVRSVEYVAPSNKLEETLVAIWEGVLNRDKVGINDNFFELGGHSLKVTSLVSKIHKELEVKIPVTEIFKRPTIKGISQYIQTASRSIFATIDKVEEREYYPTSSAQKRMYMLQQFDLASTAYNMPGVFQIQGSLNLERFEQAFHQLIQRHETLRTSFLTIDDQIVQRIQPVGEFELEVQDGSGQQIEELVAKAVRPFDLSKAPLIRVELIRLQKDEHLLIFDMHHIISDGISMNILVDEFAALYEAQKLADLRIQYKDYAVWQSQLFQSPLMQQQEKYWVERFSDELPVLNLPTDYSRPAVSSYVGQRMQFGLDQETVQGLRQLAHKTDSTMYMVLLAGINILLAKYSGQKDLIVGSPIAGRPHADLEKLIGIFVNTLAMRNYPSGEKSVQEFLGEVRQNALTAYENQDYQFEVLVEKLDLQRDLNRNPLFDVMFVMQNMDTNHLQLGDLKLTQYDYQKQTAKFDLVFAAMEVDGTVSFDLDYSSLLYKAATIERMVTHLKQIFTVMATGSDTKLSELEMLSPEEKTQLLNGFNAIEVELPRIQRVQDVFEGQVARHPEQIAIRSASQVLTYQELNERANGLARTLRERGVGSDQIVGLLTQRSVEMMVGILGILKAGGAYLPISPDYPEERIQYILADSQAQIILTQNQYLNQVGFGGQILSLEEANTYAENRTNLTKVNTIDDLAYVIYTSGSTGQPKGVVVEHGSLINTMQHLQQTYPLTADDLILQSTVYSFDASVREIFWWFFGGATCYLLAHDGEKNPYQVVATIAREKITMAKFVPVLLQEIFKVVEEQGADALQSLKYLFVGGEALTQQLVQKYLTLFNPEKRPRLINVYGPTEATIHCTEYEVTGSVTSINLPIGQGISNTQIYLLDQYLKPVPVGVPGTIYISGAGLARGYLNNPLLTAERFVDHLLIPGKKMYNTGDLARWLPDGNLEFLGRRDHQVKIRGYRIELGEIESVLLEHPQVEEAVVIERVDALESKYLCGYIVAKQGVSLLELKEYLAQSLPEYMVPAHFVQLEKLPLTSSGKINRKALPEPEGQMQVRTEYAPPENETEEKLVTLWQEVLDVESIGVNDSFFDLGGHSLKATVLLSKVHREFDLHMSLSELFQRPTIRGMSKYLKQATQKAYQAIEQVAEKAYYPTSSAQKRIYLLQQFALDSTTYNMPGVLELQGILDRGQVEQALTQLIKRHETLRTSFSTLDEEIVQKISPEVAFELEYLEVQGPTLIEEVLASFVRPFDLSQAPLLRVRLIQKAVDQHLLVFDIHHIISDGISMGILIEEFGQLYQGQELSPLRIQYKDFADWQNQLLQSGEMEKQAKYWLARFSGEIPVLNLPTDYVRPKVQSFAGDRLRSSLDQRLTANLKKVAQSTGSTLYMVLLSAVNILLAKYSRQDDIIVGSPIAGRPHPDLESLIGVFVNTLPMRNAPLAEKRYLDFLAEVRENALQAYENQDYQFEELVNQLDLQRDVSRNPLFDVMFALQNVEQHELRLPNLRGIKHKSSEQTSKFDLSITAEEVDATLEVVFEYSTKIFKRTTIERMMAHLKEILGALTVNPEIQLGQISMLTEEEKIKILHEFNATEVDYPADQTIPMLFEERVRQNPDQMAIVATKGSLTYQELNRAANRLARMLQAKGVGPGSIVGILTRPGMEMFIGILAVMKAGGGYLPIDPNYPVNRIQYMLHDSQSELLLTTTDLQSQIESEIETIDLDRPEQWSMEDKNLPLVNQATDLAYVIYTSGSTGKPKGVAVEHQSLINLCYWHIDRYDVTTADRITKYAGFGFDASILEIFPYLVAGATLYVIPDEIRLDLPKLNSYFVEHQITVCFLPTQLCEQFVKLGAKNSLRMLLTGGDNLKTSVETDYQVVDNYGPAENTVVTTNYVVDGAKENIPIGKPIANHQVYILDPNDQLQPIGVPGELCVSGRGLARGYLHKPELTAERFVTNPVTGARMYRTGDLARWLPDGNLEFLGRIDDQVQIRGFRVELGGIENQLLALAQIDEGVVVKRVDKQGNDYLCGYFVSAQKVDVAELRRLLAKELPDYMIPSYLIQLEELPLTANGKVDRKSLPKPDGEGLLRTDYVAPRNQAEAKMVEIWAEVLEVGQIGIYDNFFELGGHSLTAIQISSKIRKEYQQELPLEVLFNGPTIADLVTYLSNRGAEDQLSIEAVEAQEHYAVSSGQKRLYVLQQMDQDSVAYNMPTVFELTGAVEVTKIAETFKTLIQRHESLRTSFKLTKQGPVQVIHDQVDFDLEYAQATETEVTHILNEFIKSFDLTQPPLLRVKMVQLATERYLLMVDMHHIISDGSSMGIFVKEFMALYNGKSLPELRIHYKDYSEWLNSEEVKRSLARQEQYWLQEFAGDVPVLNLPTDFSRTEKLSSAGNRLAFEIEPAQTQVLKELALQENGTVNMVLLAVYNVLLYKLTGQTDLVVGTPIAGRHNEDLKDIIGMFVNTLAIRNQLVPEQTFVELVREVRVKTLQAYQNQDYQFEDLLNQLYYKKEAGRNPLFDVLMAFQNLDIPAIELPDLSLKPYGLQHQISKFDLSLYIMEEAGGLMIHVEYRTQLFKEETIEMFMQYFREIVDCLVTDWNIPLDEINISSDLVSTDTEIEEIDFLF